MNGKQPQLPAQLISVLPELKSKYTSVYLLDISKFRLTPLAPGYVLIRPLTRREFNLYSSLVGIDPTLCIDRIISCSLLWPDKIVDDYLAGIDDYISRAVYNISGFTSEEQLAIGIQEGRGYAGTLEACITMFICKAFPAMRPSDVDGLSFEEIMRYASMAEQLLQMPIPYEHFLYPEKFKQKEKKKVDKQTARERLLMRQMAARQVPIPQANESYQTPEEPADRQTIVVDRSNFAESQRQLMEFMDGR